MAGTKRTTNLLKHLTPIAATALVLIILLATSLPLMHWFSAQGVDAALTENLGIWRAHAIVDYDFTMERRCDCPPPANVPVRVEVRGGSAVSAVALGGQAVDTTLLPNTLSAVFDTARAAVTAEHDFVEVTYDDVYGFPRRVEIDPWRAVSGDDVTISIVSFRPVAASE